MVQAACRCYDLSPDSLFPSESSVNIPFILPCYILYSSIYWAIIIFLYLPTFKIEKGDRSRFPIRSMAAGGVYAPRRDLPDGEKGLLLERNGVRTAPAAATAVEEPSRTEYAAGDRE